MKCENFEAFPVPNLIIYVMHDLSQISRGWRKRETEREREKERYRLFKDSVKNKQSSITHKEGHLLHILFLNGKI